MNNENITKIKFVESYKVWKSIIVSIILFSLWIGIYFYISDRHVEKNSWQMLNTTVSQIGMLEQVTDTEKSPQDGNYVNLLHDLNLTQDHLSENSYLTYKLARETHNNRKMWIMNAWFTGHEDCKKFLKIIKEAQGMGPQTDSDGNPIVYWKKGEEVLNGNCKNNVKGYLVQLAVPVGLWKVENN